MTQKIKYDLMTTGKSVKDIIGKVMCDDRLL